MNVGDKVEWVSQSGGTETKKVGTIVRVVPFLTPPDKYIPLEYPYSLGMYGLTRDHESYLVKVDGKGNRLYWPLVKYLKQVQDAVHTVPFQHKTPAQEIASLRKNLDELEIELGETRRRHGVFMRKIKKMLSYKNWPDFDGDFLDAVANLLEQKLDQNRSKATLPTPKTEQVGKLFIGFEKRKPTKSEKLCPFDDVPYNEVPGYEPGYGCPVCKAIGLYHLPVPANKKKASKNRKAGAKK